MSRIFASFIMLTGFICFSRTAFPQSPGGVSLGIKLWLKADAGIGVADGTKIASWPDQSAAGYNLTQATTAIQPVFYQTTVANLVNYNPSVLFASISSTSMTNTTANLFGGGALGSSYHFIAVGRDNSAQNIVSPNFGNNKLHSILGNGATGDNPAMDFQKDPTSFNGWALFSNPGTKWSGGDATVYNGGGIGNGTEALPAALVNQLKNAQPQVIGIGYTLGAANDLFSWVDGFKQQTTLLEAVSHITNANLFTIGISGGTEYWTGPINEVIVFNRQLSDAEMQQVNSYLAIKYGITLGQGNNSSSIPTYNVGFDAANYNYLASDASVIWNATANSGNPYNIGAIARDDNSALNQKQSRSVNFGDQVAIGLETIAVSNAANSNGFKTDKAFLVWGDNGSGSSLAAANTALTYDGNSTSLRMNRVWLIQNTNATQTVKISIPSTSIGAIAIGACEKLRLLVASDAGFTALISATTNLTLNGSNYECYYKFPAGTSYFSFGRIEIGAEGFANDPTAVTQVLGQSTCMETGWIHYYADAGLTKKILAINKNGNAGFPDYNGTVSGMNATVTYNATVYSATNGVSTTNIMQRLLTITDPTSGVYTTNGGLKVRFYFDSTELTNTLPASVTDQKWFKHSGTAAATIADLGFAGVNNITVYTGLTVGLEDTIAYVEFTGIQSFSTFGFAATNSNIPLPVVLLYFNAALQGSKVQLSWATAQETNSDHFDIERNTDVDTAWQSIGTIAAQGLSNLPHDYYFTDYAPVTGNNFYRLKQVDRDGKAVYSSIKEVDLEKQIALNFASLDPNPSISAATRLVLDAAAEENITVTVYSQTGQAVWKGEVTKGAREKQLTIYGLVSGVYTIRLHSIHHDQVIKWIAQKGR
jgi:trimeric autotransporter adhesin